ncbi:hypothetical protein HELRODRAFT_189331 [Helobdella robusta]|uniref:Aminopeptidase n=1 Tax=Helobdella robusta TaxID=6412 RepID=T1FQY9_HELRO|nr:hypothetical protein HELRODRAFT_189331 [Helobdella robusta]ESN96672.1 hypothetical protein HELRODRAFT_189331 [Helobdella robusta]
MNWSLILCLAGFLVIGTSEIFENEPFPSNEEDEIDTNVHKESFLAGGANSLDEPHVFDQDEDSVEESTLVENLAGEYNDEVHENIVGERFSEGAMSDSDLIVNNRIPHGTLVPYHYDLYIRPNILTTPPFYANGTVRVYFECLLETNVLHLNVFHKLMTVDKNTIIFMLSPDNTVIAPVPELFSITSRPEMDMQSYQTKRHFMKGAKYIFQAEYRTTMGKQGEDGFYWDSYVDNKGVTKYIAATQLESVDARKLFPCMDEVDMKATFDIFVQIQANKHTALSNMPPARNVLLPSGWTEVQFKRTPLMSTYLVCIIVGEFIRKPVNTPPTMKTAINLYAVETQQYRLEFMARFAVAQLQKWYDDTTGYPYREPKLDHVALPNKGGAMENWGIITYGEELLCMDNETTSIVGLFNGVTIVSHELAHMWYGNLLTCKWWDDLWIQEGFATHYNYNPTEVLGWDWMLTQQSDQRRGIQNFMIKDQKNTTDPVRKTILTPQNSESAFTSSTYNKGGALIRMIQGILSRPVMNSAYSKYLKKYAYTNVVTKNLTDALDEEAKLSGITYPDKKPLKFQVILDSWLNIPGYPLLECTRQTNQVEIRVTPSLYLHPRKQTPISINRTEHQVVDNFSYSWEIPMRLVTNLSRPIDWDGVPSHWIMTGQTGLTISSSPTQWFILNPRQHFYYRVLYDAVNRNLLVGQLLADYKKILPETRSQLIDDNFDLARNGYLLVTDAMEFTKYLSTELVYNPWEATLRHAHFIQPFFKKDLSYAKFMEYFSSKLEKVLDELRYEFPEQETVLTTFLRKDAISSACAFANQKCLLYSRDQFKKYLASPNINTINANALPTVLCQGIFDGTSNDWEVIWNQYNKRKVVNVKDERNAYLFGLTCTSNPALVDRFFNDLVMNKTFRSRDVSQATLYLAANERGAQKLFDYLDKSWEDKSVIIPKTSTITAITNSWYTNDQLNRLKVFILNRKNLSNNEKQQLIQAVLQVELNRDFYAKNSAPLDKWLKDNVKPKSRSTIEYMRKGVDESAGTKLKNMQRRVFSVGGAVHNYWNLLQESYYAEKIGRIYRE